MRVSVIIPALNEGASIAAAVASAWQAGADEVVVVDGSSSDNTAAQASQASRVLITQPGRGHQQNQGAQVASGDWLLFLHADNRLGPAAIDQLRAAATTSTQLRHGAFRQQIEAQGVLYRWLERGNAARIRWCGVPYGDQAIFIQREWFHSAGGFPEIRLLEDYLLMRRLRGRHWPALLPGPVFVSPRRWQKRGIARQTLRNWKLLTAYHLGVSVDRLALEYYGNQPPAGPQPATPLPGQNESLS